MRRCKPRHQRIDPRGSFFANVPVNQSDNCRARRFYENLDVPDDAYPDGQIADEAIRRLQTAKTNSNTRSSFAVGFVKPAPAVLRAEEVLDRMTAHPSSSPRGRRRPRVRRNTPCNSAANCASAKASRKRTVGRRPGATHSNPWLSTLPSVTWTRNSVGLDELDRLGTADNTIIVLWGDHGWHLGDHGMWCKTHQPRGSHPSAAADQRAGRDENKTRTAALVETVDLYPTLCELAELKPPLCRST